METPATLPLGQYHLQIHAICVVAPRLAESYVWWKREFIVSGLKCKIYTSLWTISIFQELNFYA